MKTFNHFKESAPIETANNGMHEGEVHRENDPLKATDRLLYLLLVFLITTSFFLL